MSFWRNKCINETDPFYKEYTKARQCGTYKNSKTKFGNQFNCASNEFFCPESKMCIREDKVCDGVVQCPKGDDEEIEICKNRKKFPDGQ